ncbi:RHS repeat-associated core domain-containing protein [Lysinibacillus sp. CD3-6]|uniref:RHS repeat-associated core domain-containing protein n=1 Tax=Lysinibacillus sp. CD3-6 TaxID=2892541 RepID=UPI00272E123E|nr:RHS repeat-associated core domain-containing protein [Lysinibacillus sp. CD3-6]
MTEVTFKYDTLGRRIEKCSEGRATHFVWDGNTILHEYLSQDNSNTLENSVENASQPDAEIVDNLVTWVFNDGFVPSAKITNDGYYSIISDYLGTPVEAYDEQGHKVWSAELDVYGRVKEFTGEKDFIPFRYQGQYEDVEIGLYYNRFRYYDPEQGNYTQVDPIGLAGGNPTLYAYVRNPTILSDVFGLAPTNPNDRAFLKEILGTSKKSGGAYMFRTIDVRDGITKWYVGKANNLYTRLRQHLGSGKLTSSQLESLQLLVVPHGKESDFFKTEAGIIKAFEDAGEDLANKIKSPGCSK